MTIDLKLFGPIGAFAGTWQSSRGADTAPGDFRDVEKNVFREEIIFTPVEPTDNHEQTLYVLSCTRTAWRLLRLTLSSGNLGIGFGIQR